MSYTPKQRMLNAYRGVFSDRWPVAPEFWYYYPAKVLGVDMVQFEREVPHWQALQVTFKRFGTEGWGIVGADRKYAAADSSTTFSYQQLSPERFRVASETLFRGHTFRSVRVYDKNEPSWMGEWPVKRPEEVPLYLELALPQDSAPDFTAAKRAYEAVGEDYLLEMWVGVPFFDFIAGFMGFERAVQYFAEADPGLLRDIRQRYTDSQVEFVRAACAQTRFEAFFVGCSYSNNSLLGPRLWRLWDRPFLEALAAEVHRHSRLLHVHIHGKCMETVRDFAEIGLDCVCPFERPPGGDVAGIEGLKRVRAELAGRVTMNGNVHTVETLIRGTPERVRAEVREIKEAFAGEPRLIIGTGDQVGKETPEENIVAMVEEAKLNARH